jgi:CubicO group peptidase (beta-lactamase class C family)
MARATWSTMLVALAAWPVQFAAAADVPAQAVDQIFADWTHKTPGCAVGVAQNHRTLLIRAYGEADLEHQVPISPATVFEIGSVSKQFTATAVMLLAQDGRLSLDDPVRRFVPELPDYGKPITVRQMLMHTSGLREWSDIAMLDGWPRTTRAYSDEDLLDIVKQQSGINFSPGTQWSYSNTGYNLAEIIVSRITGSSLAQYTKDRMFIRLGMTHTSWRDDYTRVVPDRAIAYSKRTDGFHQLMPFENTYGHGGLLTTVGDLLIWSDHVLEPDPSTRTIVAEQERPGHLDSGRPLHYGLGLFIGEYRGQPEVWHDGATAGYRAFLAQYPRSKLSVAVLCNSEGAQVKQYAHSIVDLYSPSTETDSDSPAFGGSDTDASVSTYLDLRNRLPAKVRVGSQTLSIDGAEYAKVSPSRYRRQDVFAAVGQGEASLTLRDGYGVVAQYRRAVPVSVNPRQLLLLSGRYASPDLEAPILVIARQSMLEVHFGTKTTLALSPIAAHTFSNGDVTIFFSEDSSKRPTMTLSTRKAWNLHLVKVANGCSSVSPCLCASAVRCR